jgi:hypothetical protein
VRNHLLIAGIAASAIICVNENAFGGGDSFRLVNLVGGPWMDWTYTHVDGYNLGYSFTPNTDIQINAVLYTFGTSVSIWTASGARLVSQTVGIGNGYWTQVPLSTPITLSAGVTYEVSSYEPNNTAVYFTSYVGEWPTSFKHGTIGQSCCWGYADNFPSYFLGGTSMPLVDLVYTVVPEPSTLALLGTSTLSFLALFRRQRHAPTPPA